MSIFAMPSMVGGRLFSGQQEGTLEGVLCPVRPAVEASLQAEADLAEGGDHDFGRMEHEVQGGRAPNQLVDVHRTSRHRSTRHRLR